MKPNLVARIQAKANSLALVNGYDIDAAETLLDTLVGVVEAAVFLSLEPEYVRKLGRVKWNEIARMIDRCAMYIPKLQAEIWMQRTIQRRKRA